jgi:hypothetical protein
VREAASASFPPHAPGELNQGSGNPVFGKTKEKAEAWLAEQIDGQANQIITAIYSAVAVIIILILAVVTRAS